MRRVRAVACLATCLTVTTEGSPGAQSVAVHRVRAEKPAVTALIDEGLARSATFAALVAAVDRTDGLVYVEEGTCGSRVRACLAMSLVVAGPYRVLRIQIHPRRPRRELIAAIGHELQHVLEALAEPGVRDSVALLHFFLRTAPTARETFETPAAIRAGLRVFDELGAAR